VSLVDMEVATVMLHQWGADIKQGDFKVVEIKLDE